MKKIIKGTKIQKIIYFYNEIIEYKKPYLLIGNGVKFVNTSFIFPRHNIELILSFDEIEQIQQAHNLREEFN